MEKLISKKRTTFMHVTSSTTFYYWASQRQGLVFSTVKVCPMNKKKGDKISYLGHTNDADWPKRMNTGRILYKNKGKKKRRAPDKN